MSSIPMNPDLPPVEKELNNLVLDCYDLSIANGSIDATAQREYADTFTRRAGKLREAYEQERGELINLLSDLLTVVPDGEAPESYAKAQALIENRPKASLSN
jgi:hypothetical protein